MQFLQLSSRRIGIAQLTALDLAAKDDVGNAAIRLWYADAFTRAIPATSVDGMLLQTYAITYLRAPEWICVESLYVQVCYIREIDLCFLGESAALWVCHGPNRSYDHGTPEHRVLEEVTSLRGIQP